MTALPSDIRIYITDQNHPAQRDRLPDDATPGFVVTVYRVRKGRKPTLLETMWNRTHAGAERMANEYARKYAIMVECGWR